MKIKKPFYRKCFCFFLYILIATAIISLGELVVYLFDISVVDGSNPWYLVCLVVCILLIVEAFPIAALYNRMTPQNVDNSKINTDIYSPPEDRIVFGDWVPCGKCHGRGKLPKKHVEERFPKNMDSYLPDVAEWVVGRSTVSTKEVSEYFSLGYTRAALVLDQLESIGVLSEKYGPKNLRRVLVGAARLSLMKEDGYFGIDFLRSDLYETMCPCCKGEGKIWGRHSKRKNQIENRQNMHHSMSEDFRQISGEEDENFYGDSAEKNCYNRLEEKISSMEKKLSESKDRELLQSVNGNSGCLFTIGFVVFMFLLNQCSWDSNTKDKLTTIEAKVEALNTSLDRIQYKVELVKDQAKLNTIILKEIEENKKEKKLKHKSKKHL